MERKMNVWDERFEVPYATTVTCFLHLSLFPLLPSPPYLDPSTYFLLPFSPSSIFPPPSLPPFSPSLPPFTILSQSLTQSLTSSFNILQYFPYLDHSLLPHSTMLFTVLSCMFNISHYFLLFRSLSSPSLNHVVHCTLLRVQYFTLFSLI